MARAYSSDLRERVLDATAAGMSARAAGRRFGVGMSTAVRWADRALRSGERTARRQGRPKGSRLDTHAPFIEGMIDKRKDITLAEMAARLFAERGVSIGRGSLCEWLRSRDWTYKKVWSRAGAGSP